MINNSFCKLINQIWQEIHASENVFRLLVHSLCPTIFGHEVVKAGLLLGLFGGTETENGVRPNPHVLIVGDPGLGKSQLLQAAAHAAPRGTSFIPKYKKKTAEQQITQTFSF